MRRVSIVTALVVALAVPSAAVARTTIYNDPVGLEEGWVREPDHLEHGGGPGLNSEARLRNLNWSGWGEKRAYSTARFLRCRSAELPDDECRATSAFVIASRLSPDAIPGVRDHVYKKLKIVYGNELRVFKLLLPAPGR